MNEYELPSEALKRTDPAERAAFLDQTCAQDSELRRRLVELLAGYADSGGLLDEPSVAPAESMLTDHSNIARIYDGGLTKLALNKPLELRVSTGLLTDTYRRPVDGGQVYVATLINGKASAARALSRTSLQAFVHQ